MNKPQEMAGDFWSDDDFEQTVAAALIACFETQVKPQKGAMPADRLNHKILPVLRREGPYIASNSRLVELQAGETGIFDLGNDTLPRSGLSAALPHNMNIEDYGDGVYLIMHYIRRADSLGKHWVRRAGGPLYEMFDIVAAPEGLCGERWFFSVDKQGNVVACDQQVQSTKGGRPGVKIETLSQTRKNLEEHSKWASVALQFLSDRRFCWTITARESEAKAHLGCMQEEIKSLLYARDLPRTVTGRKRPILHLVEAHKRRMRNGTEVDITAFLRGQRSVVIDGTQFTVTPPATLRQNVSENSVRRYFDQREA